MIIPAEKISADALQGLIEAYITREGTDYGEQEVTLEQKVAQVQEQLQQREVVIVFDEVAESVSLLSRREAEQFERELRDGRSVEEEWQEYGGC